ncbi:MAG: hypothetical protein ACYC9S_03495 [Leptospirales bacterium]
MGFFSFKKSETKSGAAQVADSGVVSDEMILKEAYKGGRFTPSNTQCSPNFINNWVDNNVECFEPIVNRIFTKYNVGDEMKKTILLEMYRGFSDLILAEPEIEESAFRLKNPEAIRIAHRIFEGLAVRHAISIN